MRTQVKSLRVEDISFTRTRYTFSSSLDIRIANFARHKATSIIIVAICITSHVCVSLLCGCYISRSGRSVPLLESFCCTCFATLARERALLAAYRIIFVSSPSERPHGFRTCLGPGQHVTWLQITRIWSIPDVIARARAHVVRNATMI